MVEQANELSVETMDSSPERDAVSSELEYAGFWIRLLAECIDIVLILLITGSISYAIYGPIESFSDPQPFVRDPIDFLISYLFPAVGTIVCWVIWSANPGKMVLNLKIVDARTGKKPSLMQFIGRYLAYFLSFLALGIGFITIAINKRRQGWHDKLAKTVVVRIKVRPETVKFQDEVQS